MNKSKSNFDPAHVAKTAGLATDAPAPSDIEKINTFTLKNVGEDEVFTFKAYLGDNMGDDRNYAPFTAKALEDMARSYIGKTLIFDHDLTAFNQVGRVYDTALVDLEGQSETGEQGKALTAKVYMMRTDSNADLIREIEGGIKSEVSTDCMPEHYRCNICGADNMTDYCPHWPGEVYDGKTCKMWIDGVSETYELSFVAVPAQPRAGTRKGAGVDEEERMVSLRIAIAEATAKANFEDSM